MGAYIHAKLRMKVFILLVCFVATSLACKTDKDCKDGCCVGVGPLKFCKKYLKEGERCTISEKVGCGCEPGLYCMHTGAFTKRCVKLLTGDCGKPAIQGTRVVAGKDAVRGSWPWQILLKYAGSPMCGGTLIAPQWVITAAHCVYKRENYHYLFDVVVGEYDRNKVEGTEVSHKVENIFRHSGWSAYTLTNDITLIKLKKPVVFNKYVMPACLPSTDPKVGSDCYITGWGKIHHPGRMHNILQQGRLPVVSNEVCNALTYKHLGIRIKDTMICGGDGGKTKLMGCHGDSGGPFVCNINGRWELHGDVSFGSAKCDSSESYTVFARTNYFKPWIYDIMSQNK